MKWKTFFLGLILACSVTAAPNEGQNIEIRKIRRAYLDVTGLLPTPEEVDWYIVYNKDGYSLAVDYLVQKAAGTQWTREKLTSAEYLEGPSQPIERSTLELNLVYLSGLLSADPTPALIEEGTEAFIKNALLATDENPSNAIDYMVNLIACRPSSAEEENQLGQIYNKVSLKEDEMSAWKTVLLHILEMPDCKNK